MNRLVLGVLHEPKSCVLHNALRILATFKAHGKGLVPKIFTQLEASNSYYMWLNILTNPF